MKCACGRDAEVGISTYGYRPFIPVCGHCDRAIREDMQTGGEPEYCELRDIE